MTLDTKEVEYKEREPRERSLNVKFHLRHSRGFFAPTVYNQSIIGSGHEGDGVQGEGPEGEAGYAHILTQEPAK
jgi:hypothetical protein